MTESMTGTNEEQIAFWNGPSGARWVHHQERLDRALEPIGRALLVKAAAKRVERVIDVGCGCGATTLFLARASASVTAVDVSEPMLARARERAKRAGIANIKFVLADAATQRFEVRADLLFSRFGVMFFRDPLAAFKNLHDALRAGGRLAFACWRAQAENPWMMVPLTAAATVIPAGDPPPPNDPGPFAFADEARVREILTGAGFTDVAVDPLDGQMLLGTTLDEAVVMATEAGPTTRLMGMPDVDDKTRERVREAVRAALSTHVSSGRVSLPTATWIVTARRG